ncbi:uncharacterized protein [Coffea arabica]|uniref:C2H2-type domain-containing protein n=1 Tax=Coffea arabica TaxID=13443 RepID=A0A6P6TXP3_COFAR|nr:zinc finger protein ZAT4-like [Coffea arabica]
MGMAEDHVGQLQEPTFKHFCRVCKRGFGCAGALGGHMRSHAVGDVRMHQSSRDQEIGTSGFMRSNKGEGGSKHSYFLRTNSTNRFTGACRAGEDLQEFNNKRAFTRSAFHDERGKFSSSVSSSESEVEEMMLKSARAKSKNYEDRHCAASSEEEDLANCLVMLSNESFVQSDKEQENTDKHVEKGMFQCKACKKVFSSHQALGGHRASHKKVKGCYAARFNSSTNLNDQDNDNNYEDAFYQHEEHLAPSENSSEPGLDLDFSPHHDHLPKNTTLSKRKSKAHQCSICQRVFSSGQALGGHKRCHWLTSNLPDNTIIQNLLEFQFDSQQLFKKPMLKKPEPPPLDLNFPPLLNNAVDNLHMNSADDALNYEAPARIFLQLWGNEEADNNTSNNNHQQKYTTKSVVRGSLHDEDERAKEDGYRAEHIAKLSNLKDMNLDGGSSRWLQVGIASTTDITATP